MVEPLIVLDVKGKEVVLPLKDAKELYKTLHDVFGYEKEVNIEDHTHYHNTVVPLMVPKQPDTNDNPTPPRWQC